jgi:hypothetical protein
VLPLRPQLGVSATGPDLDLAPPLPTIDLDARAAAPDRAVDRRAYEDRFAELGFGLGTVPRRVHRDDPWWETSAGVLTLGAVLLALAALLAST